MSREREVPVRIIVRRKRDHAAHHGGAWKVALADFMTAMFALFLVLWLVNQSSDVKAAVAGYFQDPLGRANEFGSSILPGEGAQASTPRILKVDQVIDLRRDRLQRLADRIAQRLRETPDLAAVRDFVEIELTDEGLLIQLIEDPKGVFFETGRPTPSGHGREILALLGNELGTQSNPVRIEGYTDARQYSDPRSYSNWELSADRANVTRRILTENGLPASQVVEIRGHADRSLRDPRDPYAARNRRITITVLLADSPRDSSEVLAPADSSAAPMTEPAAADSVPATAETR